MACGLRPVHQGTPFLMGSASKSFTATALMRLVSDGWVELDAPVRRYVPELKLADERSAADITVPQPLNHTAGLDWRFGAEPGEGDDALASYVARLAESEPVGPPGGRSSYSQTGYNLAGRIIEKVTGLPFDRAVAALLFEPLGMASTTYMQQPTVGLRGTSLGDAMGIGWFLRDTGGVRVVEHGGSAGGQFAELVLVPERDFAVVASNEGPDGGLALNRAVVRWVLEHYLGVVDRDPEPLPHDRARAGEVVGNYENEMMTLTIATDGAGLTIACAIKPELRAASDAEMPADLPAAGLGLLAGDGDEYVVTGGGLRGQRGFFTRDEAGTITGADLGGRLFPRTRRTAPGSA